MKLHFLKYDALASLRANVEGNLEKYRLPVNDWIYEFFRRGRAFRRIYDHRRRYQPCMHRKGTGKG